MKHEGQISSSELSKSLWQNFTLKATAIMFANYCKDHEDGEECLKSVLDLTKKQFLDELPTPEEHANAIMDPMGGVMIDEIIKNISKETENIKDIMVKMIAEASINTTKGSEDEK